MFTEKDIAIVILNWNGKQLLQKFLPSVISFSGKAQIYVADNASNDDSCAFINSEYPTIQLIKNRENGGFAKGYNDALKHISSPILCLLNNDIEVTENWLEPILKEFNTNTSTGIIQPKILDYNNKTSFEYAGAAGGYIDKYAYPYCRGRLFNSIEKDTGQYNDRTEIFWASGACFFIKNDVFKSLHGFDDSFFAHMEEIDLCWRAFNANYNSVYIGGSSVYHVGGATLTASNPRKTFLNFRNSLYTLTKNTDTNVFGRVLMRLFLDGMASINFLLQLKPKHTFAILKAHFSYYQNISQLLQKRKASTKRSKYWTSKSIVWSYFVLKKQNFMSI